MFFSESSLKGHRIYAGAIEVNTGGYAAAVAVEAPSGGVIYFNDQILRHRMSFLDANEALHHAVMHGRRMIELGFRATTRASGARKK